MKKFLYVFLCAFVLYQVSAQDITICSDEDFRLVMRDLVSKGNSYYENSDRYGISRISDSIHLCLIQRSQCRRLTRMDSLEFMADWYKLQGSYYYENTYYDSTSYEKAHWNYQRAFDIYRREASFGGDLRCEPMIHRELAQLYYKERNYQKAYHHTKEAYDAYENAVNLQEIEENDPDILDIRTQMAICQARIGNTKGAISIIDELLSGYEQTDIRYGEALRKKAKILMLQKEKGTHTEDKSSRTTNSTEALKCYKKFFELKKKDALARFMGMNSREREMYWMKIRPFVADCYRLEDADAGFLFNVTLFSKGLLLQLDSIGGGRQNIHATWQMIQERLKPNACAIEFVQYEKYGKQQMGAMVLKKKEDPIFVKLASPDSIWNYLVADRTVADRLERTDKDNFNAIDRVYNDSSGLYRIIWNKELLAAIGDCENVYFAPDGYMHRIAIEYMLPEELSKRNVFRLTSTRCLLESQQISKNSKALIIGDVDFTKASVYSAGDNDALAYQSIGKMYFGPLKKSREEVDSIRTNRGYPSDALLCGAYATEQEFRRICKDYPIIHISSHGKFKADDVPLGTDIKPCLTDMSLSESIIALAGVNKTLNDETFDAEHMQDGLLSARELSSMDMNDVQLVVLACCETGLGHITSDGVYGIQRGLKNAGVKTIVMTLWDADDDMTAEFMGIFHQKISEGKNIRCAFAETRAIFTKIDDDSINRPCYRNVFVLIDALE